MLVTRSQKTPLGHGEFSIEPEAVEVGDILFGLTDTDFISKLISWMHGFFTHSAIVVEVDGHGRPATIAQVYGSGLETRPFSYFEGDYASLAIGRHERFVGDTPDEQLRELIHGYAMEHTVPHQDIDIDERIALSGLFKIIGSDQSPEGSGELRDGYGFSGYDIALAAVLASRTRLREVLRNVPFLTEPVVASDGENFRRGALKYRKSARRGAGSERVKRFTCAGWVYNVFHRAHARIEPNMLEDLYGDDEYRFNAETLYFDYQGSAHFSLAANDGGIGAVNVLDAFERQGATGPRPARFDLADPEHANALDQYLEAEGLDPDHEQLSRMVALLETIAIGVTLIRGIPSALNPTAYRIQNVVGPVDLWESPSLSHRFFLKGADLYQDHVEKAHHHEKQAMRS